MAEHNRLFYILNLFFPVLIAPLVYNMLTFLYFKISSSIIIVLCPAKAQEKKVDLTAQGAGVLKAVAYNPLSKEKEKGLT